MTTANISLKVPFNEKDQAKALGARWNAELKQWYVPQGVESAPFEKWFTSGAAPVQTGAALAKPASPQGQPSDEDMDSINARLREAFEFREPDEM